MARNGSLHTPTEETKRKVVMLLAAGETFSDIALNLNIAENTFRRHYSEEIRIAKLDRKYALLERMEKLSDGQSCGESAKYEFNATRFMLERYYPKDALGGSGEINIRIDSSSGDL